MAKFAYAQDDTFLRVVECLREGMSPEHIVPHLPDYNTGRNLQVVKYRVPEISPSLTAHHTLLAPLSNIRFPIDEVNEGIETKDGC
jgi:hypothetical protein